MNERGSMLPYFGALFFVGFVLLGLALDVALLAATYREAAVAADVGAEAGAAQLEAAAAYDGQMRLDEDSAVAAAEAASLRAQPRAGRSAAASTDGLEVCVTVTDRFEPRILATVGIGSEGIVVRACATPQQG